MSVSKPSKVWCRRSICVGFLTILGFLSQGKVNSTKQISGTNIDSFCANDVPTPCFYESEGVAKCHPLVGIFASDSATPKISSSAIYNLTCSFYGASDGQCSCLMDDPEFEMTRAIPCISIDEHNDLHYCVENDRVKAVSIDGTALASKTVPVPGNTRNFAKLGWENTNGYRIAGLATCNSPSQPKCWIAAYQGSSHPCAPLKADSRQAAHYLLNTWTTVQSLSRLLRGSTVWKVSLKTDAVSLALFRMSCQKRLLNHLDTIGAFCQRKSREIHAPSISASMFLPQKSVWSFAKRDKRYVQPSPAEYTTLPKMLLDPTKLDDARMEFDAAEGEGIVMDEMARQFAYWAMVAKDFDRQSTIPGLRSGNTVIDERNFSMS